MDQRNSSISSSVEKLVATAFGNRRRTLKWRIGSSNILTASTSDNDYKEFWSSTVPLMPFKASAFDTDSTSEPKDVHQQSWTLHPKSEIADDLLKASTTSDQPLEETKKVNTQNASAERSGSMLESFQTRTDAMSISSSSVMASDVFRFDYGQNRESEFQIVTFDDRYFLPSVLIPTDGQIFHFRQNYLVFLTLSCNLESIIFYFTAVLCILSILCISSANFQNHPSG